MDVSATSMARPRPTCRILIKFIDINTALDDEELASADEEGTEANMSLEIEFRRSWATLIYNTSCAHRGGC